MEEIKKVRGAVSPQGGSKVQLHSDTVTGNWLEINDHKYELYKLKTLILKTEKMEEEVNILRHLPHDKKPKLDVSFCYATYFIILVVVFKAK